MQALVDLSKIFVTFTNNQPNNKRNPVVETRNQRETPITSEIVEEYVPQSRVMEKTPNKTPQDTHAKVHQPRVEITKNVTHTIPYKENEVPAIHRYNLRKRQLAYAVMNKETGKLEEYSALVKGPDKEIWEKAYANDLGRLAQVIQGRIEGTKTVFFIAESEVPKDKRVTYGKKEVSIRPNKAETHRVRLTV